MPLSTPASRQPQHLRDVRYRSFLRDDGLMDVEGELIDTKAHDIMLHGERRVPAGTPIHHMWLRVTIDREFRVTAIEAAMDDFPLGECPEALASLQSMVGVQMGRGWRMFIQERLGGTLGCTHLRELLVNMATAAFQTDHSAFRTADPAQPPAFLGQCRGWGFQGQAVARYYPQFVGFDPKARAFFNTKKQTEPTEPA